MPNGQEPKAEPDRCCSADCGEEELTVSAVAGGDATPTLSTEQQVLNPVTLLVWLPVWWAVVIAFTTDWHPCSHRLVFMRSLEPVGVLALITKSALARGLPRNLEKNGRNHSICASINQKCPLITPTVFRSLNHAAGAG